MRHAEYSAAVLGASGFLGGALAGTLDRAGTTCQRYTRERPFVVEGRLAPGLERADAVYWLVSSIRPATAAATDKVEHDLAALDQLLELLAARPTAPRLVVLSSGGTVYDTGRPPPYDESAPTQPANAYGEAMLAVEKRVSGAPNHLVLRVSNAYGPGQPARRGQGVIAHWLDAIAREEPVRVLGDPDTRRDYVYVDDLVDALLVAGRLPDDASTPRLVNIGSGVGTSLSDLVDLLPQVIHEPLEIEYGPARSFDAPSTWLDITRARETMGFRPAVDLLTGLQRTWQHVQRHDSGMTVQR